jgi:hypothetical protein
MAISSLHKQCFSLHRAFLLPLQVDLVALNCWSRCIAVWRRIACQIVASLKARSEKRGFESSLPSSFLSIKLNSPRVAACPWAVIQRQYYMLINIRNMLCCSLSYVVRFVWVHWELKWIKEISEATNKIIPEHDLKVCACTSDDKNYVQVRS